MSGERNSRAGGTGPQQPSQAEGDRETIDADLREKLGDAALGGDQPAQPGGGRTPAAREPQQRPSQAEGERDKTSS
jgi:hypothetical protein